MFNAYVRGYGDRLFDQQVLAVQAGYWAGYYIKARHPKSIQSILKAMLNKHRQSDKKMQAPTPDVDVEAFLAQERQFKERMKTIRW